MIKEQFVRNIGIMTEKEVEKLHRTTIAIAGCGCIGGFSAELLTRMGIGTLILADPDVFDVSNINRQCAATHETIGQQKVEALKNHLLSINPELEVQCYSKGVNESNVHSFVEGADYVIDAIDYFAFPESVVLHRAARKKDLFVTTAVALGFGTSVLTFSPLGMNLEEYVGISEETSIADLQGQTFPPNGYSQSLPSYATEEKITAWIENQTIPTISVGQALGPGALVSQLVLHLLDRKNPPIVPERFQLQFE
ncbi:tRNA threonylcarbamoyladenosine dehydratase [Paraliobacillus sp. PM-2]|uniref:ThiF family adenylyltransferase n=1 Tax=Paraliobacillus sp. PM-2 TaxID=1462524 RepID=UPI00061C698D|nr:ThiF family adenylyltransferase [Paraliobacillus sp. PM-2]CQR47423.1 tRNA threonylcarbamoyladenosine dehydratase [Paraliobacillus sp. PM-2]